MKIEYFDFVSPYITIYYKGFLKHSSIYSVIISLLFIIAVLVFSIIFSLDFFLKRNPTTFFYRKFIYDAGFYPFNSSGIFHFLTFGVNNYDRRAYSIIGVNFKHETLLSDNNETNYDHWIYDLCDSNDIEDKINYLESYKDLYEHGICIKQFYNSTSKKIINIKDDNFNYGFMQFGASNPNEIFYGIYIKRCENSSIIHSDYSCFDEITIDNYIKGAYNYSILFLDQNIIVDNYNTPLQYFFHKINNDINSESYTLNALNFHPCEIKSRTGIIFEKLSYYNSYVFDVNEKLVYRKNQTNENIFGSIYFSMQNMQDVYDRKYKMLQDISGSISGIINLIFIVARIINYFFYYHSIFFNLINDIEKTYIKLESQTEKSLSTIYKGIQEVNYDNYEKNNLINNNYSNKNEKSTIISNYNLSTNKNKKLNDTKKKKIKNIYINKYYSDVFLDKSKFQKKYDKFKTLCVFLWNLIYCNSKYNKSLDNLIRFREYILSEEEMFKNHFFINSLNRIIYIND